MEKRFRESILLLTVCALALSEPVNKTVKKDADNYLYQYEDYDGDDDQEVLFSEDRPCPRDCICTVSQGYKIANCNRLEVGTQTFGDDITDLVIENADPSSPIQLDDFIFKKLGLHQAATVKIVNSTISSIGVNAFHGLNELYAVNLSNNKLKSLHPETFANNKKLLLLTLSNNPLKFPAAGSEDYFLNSSSVQELDISYCNMQYISANTFNKMRGLMYLNLAGNNLSDMDSDSFKKLLDLEEIDLSDNHIKYLPDNLFSENTEVATLHIQRNPIDTVYGLQISDLLTLNAGQTNIKFVGPSMFMGMTYLANLNLSGNSMQKIHNQAFHKLVDLNYLDLSFNDLDFVSNILIKENIELDIFKISNNPKLKHLPAEGFACAADQFNLYLFDASNCGLEEIYDDSLITFTALTQINLSGNKIISLSNKVFSRCPRIVEVNLAYNQLTTLDNKVFENNKDLARLNIQGNPLKTLSAELFTFTPMLTWLDMSHGELTSLWKVIKNQPATLLSNLTFLNVSNNRINEIKQTELETLNKLRSLDISNNPLVCSREFENIMSWLNKHKVSPNTNSVSIANLARDAKDDDTQQYSWEFLTNKICGSALPHSVEPLPPVSDEEIWERIDKDAEGNFDLKDTLDDGKIADDTKLTVDNKVPVDIKNVGDPEFEDDKYATDSEMDEEDDGDDADDEDSDEAGEDYDDSDDNIDVNIISLDKSASKSVSPKSLLPKVTKTNSLAADIPNEINKLEADTVKIDIQLLEKDSMLDDPEPNYVDASVVAYREEHGRYNYLWPMLIAILGALLLLIVIGKIVMITCKKRNANHVRYNSAIISAMNQPGRTKKDCGLVYQQLSEDLTGPATPKLNRYQALPTVTVNATNLSYESSTFHHSNIVPEAV